MQFAHSVRFAEFHGRYDAVRDACLLEQETVSQRSLNQNLCSLFGNIFDKKSLWFIKILPDCLDGYVRAEFVLYPVNCNLCDCIAPVDILCVNKFKINMVVIFSVGIK